MPHHDKTQEPRIDGRVDDNNLPYLKAKVYIPECEASGEVEFLVSTGTPITTVMPKDATAMGVNLDQLEYAEVQHRFGERIRAAEMPATATFTDQYGNQHPQPIIVRIAEPTPHNVAIPSILGFQAMSAMRLVFTLAQGVISLYQPTPGEDPAA